MAVPHDEELAAARVDAARVVEDLEQELAAIGESTDAGPDDEHDAEGSTVGFERARVTALLSVARAALARLDAALVRVREGSYGRCSACGGEIPFERLQALPGVAVCARCAALRSAPRPAPHRSPGRAGSGPGSGNGSMFAEPR